MRTAPAPLGIEVTHRDTATTVALTGELDFGSAAWLRSVVEGVIAAGHEQVALDLRALSFCDSTGLGAIMRLHQLAEAVGGRLELRHPGPTVRKVLEITALDRTLHLTP